MGPRTIGRRLMWLAAQIPPLRPAVVAFYDRNTGDGWGRDHPFDRTHGLRTSGAIPGSVLKPGDPLRAPTIVYGAAQPSIVRQALAAIPDPRQCHFLDLGCGKGRALLVATEFGFSSITGVELSPELARIARRNATIFSRRNPGRTRIDVVTSDALAYPLPPGDLVIFLYNPFPRPLVEQLDAKIAAALRAGGRTLYVVYYNPTCPESFDASRVLERRYAAQIAYAPEEIGCGPDSSDAVVIWQNRDSPHPLPPGDPAVPISIVIPERRAEIMAAA